MLVETWGDVLTRSFQELWGGVFFFFPNIIIAVIIFLAGWMVGAVLGSMAAQFLRILKVDRALRSAGVDEILERGGIKLDAGAFVSGLIKWFVIVVFLVASFDVLGLTQVNAFLEQVILVYIPKVIVAVFILLIAAVVSEVLQNIVISTAKAAKASNAYFLGSITRWAIWIFAILAAMAQLNIGAPIQAFAQILFTGIVVAISIAVGLAFGLGGQNAAGEIIDRLRRDWSRGEGE